MYPEDSLLIPCVVCFVGAIVLDILASPLVSGAVGLAVLLLVTWIALQILRKVLHRLSVRAAKNPGSVDRPYRAADRDQLDLSADTIDDYRRD